ncbi:hypothetical protein O7599_12000 [Streptomyces sp. WMMC500]|uniref:hypothetical protein n=1 Tax=Streptomyces sp. WMMC500 TaxID=3015154 RepID=UPI00248BDD76|nr:hypothetical protein [Streptomyces sp. WMMC500]WBB63201.1 hypothetical protein O7599_12000 [Streptomyces sp. WMMC500]
MAGFIDRAKEKAETALNQGKEKVGEVQAQREGQALLRRLGTAYFNEQRGTGSPQEVQDALQAVHAHIAQHGDGFLTRG